MARARITPGSVGPVSVVPLGTDLDGGEQIVPAPVTDGGEPLPYPKGWKVGATVKVTTDAGVEEFVLTRWRGLARVVDAAPDDRGRFTQYQVRAWRSTRAAAEAGTRAAGELRLAEMAASHARSAAAAARGAQGDLDTTVGDLLERVPGLPEVTKLAPRTREAYLYTVAHMRELDPDLMNALPARSTSPGSGRTCGRSPTSTAPAAPPGPRRCCAGPSIWRPSRPGCGHPFNPVSAARDVIPQPSGSRLPGTARQAPTHLGRGRRGVPGRPPQRSRCRPDARTPEQEPPRGRRHGPGQPSRCRRLAHSDLRDRPAGGRSHSAPLGRPSLRAEGRGTASVTGTVAWIKGLGTVRQPRPKSQSSQRLVPLTDELVQLLVLRANVFRHRSGRSRRRRPTCVSLSAEAHRLPTARQPHEGHPRHDGPSRPGLGQQPHRPPLARHHPCSTAESPLAR